LPASSLTLALSLFANWRDESGAKAWAAGIERFLPEIKVKKYNPYSGALSYLYKPLFPRYLFARFVLSQGFQNVSYTRGVNKIVEFGAGPVAIDDELLDLLRSYVGPDGYVRIDNEPEVSDKVAITEGPFKHLTGVFDKNMRPGDRVMILLETISYQARIQVSRHLVRKIDSPVELARFNRG
jgi:transcriptional antiterminator RfaH